MQFDPNQSLSNTVSYKSSKKYNIGNNGGMGTRKLGIGYPQYCGEIGVRQVEQGFTSFFAILDDYSK